MPEGDVVHRTASRLHAALAGRVVVLSDLRWPSLATVDLTGRTVLEVVSVGKHLLTRLSADPIRERDQAVPVTLHSHLKMEGSWHVHRTGERWGTSTRRRPEDGVRAVLANEEWTAVGHRLGMLDLVPTMREADVVGHLGPDLLGPGWGPDAVRQVVTSMLQSPERTIGETLLDQRVVAGVGTFYLAEALFVRGITPWTPVAEVPDPPALVELAQRMLAVNAGRAAQSTTGDLRPGRTQWVHGRAGKPCRRCGTRIRVDPIGQAPRDRVAFYCPRCQRGPSPTARR